MWINWETAILRLRSIHRQTNKHFLQKIPEGLFWQVHVIQLEHINWDKLFTQCLSVVDNPFDLRQGSSLPPSSSSSSSSPSSWLGDSLGVSLFPVFSSSIGKGSNWTTLSLSALLAESSCSPPPSFKSSGSASCEEEEEAHKSLALALLEGSPPALPPSWSSPSAGSSSSLAGSESAEVPAEGGGSRSVSGVRLELPKHEEEEEEPELHELLELESKRAELRVSRLEFKKKKILIKHGQILW